MKMKTTLLAAMLAFPLLAQPCFADPYGHEHGQDQPWLQHRHGWHGDIHRFHDHDMGMWQRGRWYQGNHGGRMGWWWIVGAAWYFYPQPVYPYPDPYTPPMVEVAPAPAPGPVWYYCRHPAGYYPYVAECRHWEVVPAQP